MISTSLDGIMARSFFLKDFDMLKTVEEFKQALWRHLGYDQAQAKDLPAPRIAASGKQSRLT